MEHYHVFVVFPEVLLTNLHKDRLCWSILVFDLEYHTLKLVILGVQDFHEVQRSVGPSVEVLLPLLLRHSPRLVRIAFFFFLIFTLLLYELLLLCIFLILYEYLGLHELSQCLVCRATLLRIFTRAHVSLTQPIAILATVFDEGLEVRQEAVVDVLELHVLLFRNNFIYL